MVRFRYAYCVAVLVPAAFFALSLCGCPDYSHQAPIPDYSNMQDAAEAPRGKPTDDSSLP